MRYMKRIASSARKEKSGSPDFRHAFAGIAAVLVANHLSLSFRVYEVFPEIDIPLHVAGGYFVGILALAVRNALRSQRRVARAPWWYDLAFVVGCTAVVAIGREVFEYVLHATYVASRHLLKTQLSLGDTLDDLANGMIGAAFAFWVRGIDRK